jgi:hypothetical protein
MFVLPDQHSDGRWKVADPWCSPAKWSWWSESKLRAGAEEWGRRVYGAAALEADYPADSSGPRDPRVLAIVARVARRMMSLSYPGHETTMPNPPPADTGGGQAILFTRTAALGVAGSGGGGTTVGINWNPSRWTLTKDVPVYLDTSGSQKVTTAKAGTVVTAFGVKAAIDDNGLDSSWRAILVSTGGLIPGDSAMQRAILWCKAADMPDDSTSTNQAWDDSIWNLAGTPEGRFPCPAAPPCPECPDQAEVIAARDEEWEEWVLNGAPSDATPATAGKPTP